MHLQLSQTRKLAKWLIRFNRKLRFLWSKYDMPSATSRRVCYSWLADGLIGCSIKMPRMASATAASTVPQCCSAHNYRWHKSSIDIDGSNVIKWVCGKLGCSAKNPTIRPGNFKCLSHDIMWVIAVLRILLGRRLPASGASTSQWKTRALDFCFEHWRFVDSLLDERMCNCHSILSASHQHTRRLVHKVIVLRYRRSNIDMANGMLSRNWLHSISAVWEFSTLFYGGRTVDRLNSYNERIFFF